MTTGDQGVMDEEGYFSFVGRDDDVITSAGFRIGPGRDRGLPDPPSGGGACGRGRQARRAAHRDRQGLHRAQDGLRARPMRWPPRFRVSSRRGSPAHEYPREVAFIDDMPMTTTGKVIRRLLRERA